jgi:sarcosine oxidase
MKTNDWDVIVVGLGAMGSATAYHLAKSGSRVLGLDRFHPPHEFGSSHGLTRIIREAYFEHPSYVPLVQRAYELWVDLEKQAQKKLLVQTGGVMVGPPKGPLVSGALSSAHEHRLRHEVLSSAELQRRFPVFHPEPETVGVWEPRAGVLFPELIVQSHLELAARLGATLHFDEPVLKWEPEGQGVRIHTASRTYTAGRLLLSTGPWVESLVPNLKLHFSVERQVLYWFEPLSEAKFFQVPNCPIYIWQYAPHQFFYGFPNLGDGVKVALHHDGETAQPDGPRREVDAREIENMRAILRRYLPSAEGRLRATAVCLYTNTPDENFVLDRHPLYSQVLLASPCSGHGFKFSSVIGELSAMLLRDQTPPFDLSLFKISRLDGARA